ncbi:uncharacterized protein LOC141860350 [Acropora palmata]|uniref:uncharacterized protein LOC141860350 n=1 Tax=Acropora palmata TaxID=6131 RepID=UPI003DA0929D
MAAKMVLARVRSRWSSPLLVAVSVPILGVPFLSSVKAGSVKVHPRELEIYDPVEPSQDTLKPNEEEVTGFEQKVSTVRKFVWGWTTSVQEGIAKAREHFSVAEQKSLEFIELIQTDQEFQMKVGAISAAVLGGAVLAGRGRRPIRRIFYSGAVGTTAVAICYPKQAVDITLTNYDRLKAFVKEQITNLNQKRAEKPFVKEVQTPLHEAANPEEEHEPVQIVVERVNDNAPVDEQQKDVEMEDAEARLEDEVKENKGKQESPFWSKIPFLDRLVGKREDPAVVSESSLAVGNKEEIGLVATDEKKDQILLLEQTAAKANVEGDLGQSNPEDKDMYSTRS